MWKGRPVIASRVGGIQDQIEDGVNGLLLDDPRDLAGFANALGRVLGDRSFAQSMGEAAQESVRRRFLATRSLVEYLGFTIQIEELTA